MTTGAQRRPSPWWTPASPTRIPTWRGNAWTNPGDPANGVDDDGDGFDDDVHGADFFDDDSNPTDDGGHGTHVAGIIGAQGNNAVGITGVNWDAKVMALKFLDENGEGNTADAANAIDYAVSHGARVMNASWGGPAFSQALYQAIRRAGEQGVVFVAAAGNDGVNADAKPDYPAAFDLPNIISVAATDRATTCADFSNYGAKLGRPRGAGRRHLLDRPDAHRSERLRLLQRHLDGGAVRRPAPPPSTCPSSRRRPSTRLTAALLRSVDQLPTLTGKTVNGGRLNLARALGATAPPTRPTRGHDAAVRLRADPSPLPARDTQAGARLHVAARHATRAGSSTTGST